MYIYEDHMGGFYTSDHKLSYEEAYCEQCDNIDWFVGYATTRAKAWELLKNDTDVNGYGGYDYDYVRAFIDENWNE